MVDKELKRMSRRDLLEILISQMEENERLSAELEKCKEQLSIRKIAAETTGSLAEAAMKLNGVFEAADAAAKQHLENVAETAGASIVFETHHFENKADENTNENTSDDIIKAKSEAQEILEEAKLKSEKMIKEADAYWQETLKRARVLLNKT